jgi:glycosyltransferase involved in cell wall biosynthesis/SAM-dependent methyltransferase
MNTNPQVSIVMIFLNAEKFIEEAIDSAIAQTYDNWELLLVDDGSTDNSTKIALQYTEKLSGKVRYLEHEGHQNRGMSATRNLGIRNAKGKYITFLDSDDVWLPDKLEQQVAIIESHPEVALVCAPAQWWYSWTGNPDDIPRDFIQKFDIQLNTVVKPPTLLILFLNDEWASLCDILVRRELVEAVGGYEESFRGMYEDQAFHAKLCLEESVFVFSKYWYRYRQHPHACTATSHKTGQTDAARQAFLNWLEAYLSKQGLKDTEVWKIVQKKLWPYRHPALSHISGRAQRLSIKMKGLVKLIAQQTLPVPVRHSLRAKLKGKEYCPPVGELDFGGLRRVTPISRRWGFDRGQAIDRYYIEQYLSAQMSDIQGHVLEIADNTYTYQFGGDRVTKSDVLYVKEGNPKATIVGDLTSADHIPSNTFDCAILTQTLQFIYDVPATLKTLYRILKPGGVLLVTFPGISQISREDMDNWGEYWRFTTLSSQKLFEEVFPSEQLTIAAYGNVFTALSFLHGLAAEELRQEELDYRDPNYEVLITVRAVKPEVAS